ncbi:Ribokinase-like protein [Rickenella mellea]|uniref:Ribokinase-like protein n=1 Tax=Rickenella mellea TaxID=50990 RepID=A0A4Y7QA90_9AGAM|nr:Ribokinase-like protein [Rickenella mellea]
MDKIDPNNRSRRSKPSDHDEKQNLKYSPHAFDPVHHISTAAPDLRPRLPTPLNQISSRRGSSRKEEKRPSPPRAEPAQPSPTLPIPERPVCLVRGSLYIEDYIQVSTLPISGETVTSTAATTTIGGKGAIQAVAISRAGQRVELLGGIGRDGDFIPKFLSSLGVGTVRCRNPVGLPNDISILSGRKIVQYTPTGSNVSTIIPGANIYSLDPAKDAIVPPITHLLLQNEIELRVTLEYIEMAHSRDIPVILNLSPLPPDDALRDFPWQRISYLILTDNEAETLVTTLKRLSGKKLPPSRPPPLCPDARLDAGLIPPIPKQPHATLSSLTHWPPLAQTGIIISSSEEGGGAVAVFPAACSPGAQIFYHPAAPHNLASPSRGKAEHSGSVDTIAGYFVAGLMEFALFDRWKLDDVAWHRILEKAVIASSMTHVSFPPLDTLPINSIPHFHEVHEAMERVQNFYKRELELAAPASSHHPSPSTSKRRSVPMDKSGSSTSHKIRQ